MRQLGNFLKYNGKEEQKQWNVLDYNTRYYDPWELPGFGSIDKLAERYSSQSPYVYAANNPIRYTDKLGMGAEDKVKYNPMLVLQPRTTTDATTVNKNVRLPESSMKPGAKSNTGLKATCCGQIGLEVKGVGASVDFGSKEIASINKDNGHPNAPGTSNKTIKGFSVKAEAVEVATSEETVQESSTIKVYGVNFSVNKTTTTNSSEMNIFGFTLFSSNKVTETVSSTQTGSVISESITKGQGAFAKYGNSQSASKAISPNVKVSFGAGVNLTVDPTEY